MMQYILIKLCFVAWVILLIGCNVNHNENNSQFTASKATSSLLPGAINEKVFSASSMPKPAVKFIEIPVSLENALKDVDLPNWPIDWQHGFSPNGEWFVKNNTRTVKPFRLVSTLDPAVIVTEKNNFNTSEYLLIYRGGNEWSPNSDAFFASGTSNPSAGCPFSYIVIYSIGSRQLQSMKFEKDNVRNCILATWHPDGQLLAVTSNDARTIYIIDKSARIQQEIPLARSDYYVDNITWINEGIVVEVRFIAQGTSGQTLNEMWLVKPNLSKQHSVLFSSYNESFQIISREPDASRLLIEIQEYDKPSQIKLVTYNLKTKHIENQILLKADGIVPVPGNAPVSSFVTQEANINHLWIYNWSTDDIEYLGNYYSVVNWYAPANGFLVILNEVEDDFSLAIIQPQKP